MVDLNPLHDPNNEDLFIAYLDLHVVMDPIKFYHRDKVLIITWIQKKKQASSQTKKNSFSPIREDPVWLTTEMMAEIRRENQFEVGSLSHYLQGFIHPGWCRISAINSMEFG